jgi:hypothetical protein
LAVSENINIATPQNTFTSTKVLNLLHDFKVVSLSEIEKVALMNRVDTKYTLRLEQAYALLELLNASYFVLEIEGKKLSPYYSQYFDTPDYKFYLAHHAKKANRIKLRHREYKNSKISFFEIKSKSNKGRTIKSRIENALQQDVLLDFNTQTFLRQNTGIETQSIQKVLNVYYERLTLVNKNFTERVTIDFGLTFTDETQTHAYDEIVILEVKQEKTKASIIDLELKSMKIKPLGISKYCLGIISLKKDLKFNNFNKKLRLLKKYTNNALTINK